DICMYFCCTIFPLLMSGEGPTHMPRGIGKLKSLRTLGIVNIAVNRTILRDLKMLAHLRKLAVTGINKVNGQEFCSVVANLNCLVASAVTWDARFAWLFGWLD